jgi:hypothetical protein
MSFSRLVPYPDKIMGAHECGLKHDIFFLHQSHIGGKNGSTRDCIATIYRLQQGL